MHGSGKACKVVVWKTTSMAMLVAGTCPSESAVLGVASWQWTKTGGKKNCQQHATFEEHKRRHWPELVDGIMRGWAENGEAHRVA